MDTPTYSMFTFWKMSLPLPHQLICLLCRISLNWADMVPTRLGSRDRITRSDVSSIKIGAVCKVVSVEVRVFPSGETEEIEHKRMIPLTVSGRACAACQRIYQMIDVSEEMGRFQRESQIALTLPKKRGIEMVPFRYDPSSNLRLPTSVSTRSTYRRVERRDLPSKRIAFLDISDLLLRQFDDPLFQAGYDAWMLKTHPERGEAYV